MKLEVQTEKELDKVKDDLKSCILKAKSNKAMPPCILMNWKEMEEDYFFGFKSRGLYYLQISNKKKSLEKWIMYCVSCGNEKSINPYFNPSNLKVHLSSKVNGVDFVHEKNLKSYMDKALKSEGLCIL